MDRRTLAGLNPRSGARRRLTARYLARVAGYADTRREREALAEGLEERVMLSIFDPGGTNIGVLSQGDLSLTRADRVIVDIDPSAAGATSDRLTITNNASLNGVLQLRLANGGSLQAGDRFDILTAGSVGGAFAAIEGLDANGAALDFVAIQGPGTLTIVATTLPTSDFTIRVNSAAEAASLADFFGAGAGDGLDDTAEATGAILALGQQVHGAMTFAESDAGGAHLTIGVADGLLDADKARITTAASDGASVYSVFGLPTFTLRGRTEAADARGLRLDAGFAPTAYSLGDSVVPVAPMSGLSGRLGPFSFMNISPTLTSFVLADQRVMIDAGLAAESLSLTFQGSGQTNPGGVTAEATAVTATFGVGLEYVAGAISAVSGRGRFAISADEFHAEVPGVIKADATGGVMLAYDPDADRTQTLFSTSTLSIELPRLHLRGDVMPAPGSMDPGLVIRGDGFMFGSLTVTLNTGDLGGADGEGFIAVASFLRIKDPSFTITNFGMTFTEDGTVSGASPDSINLSFAEVRLDLASGVNASGMMLSATMMLSPDGVPTGFELSAATLHFEVPDVVVADATEVVLSYDPDAGRTQTLLSIGTMDIEMPKLHLSGHVEPAPGSMDPGLVIRGDGFLFGSLTITLNTGDFGGADMDGFLTVASFLKIKNPSFNITNFGMTFNEDGSLAGASVGSISLAVEEFRVELAGGTMGDGTDIVATLTFDENNVPNGYSLMAATLHFEVPGVVTADAEELLLSYDPAGGREQTLFSVSTMDIAIPRLHLSGHVEPAPGSMDPGLVIRGDGFLFGSLTVTLTASTLGGAEDIGGVQYLKVGNFLRVADPFVNVTNWGMTFNTDGTLAGTVLGSISVGAMQLIVGDPAGSFNAHGSGLVATLTFDENSVPNGFTFSATSISFSLGYVTIAGSGIEINPSAGAADFMLTVGSLTATLELPPSLFGGGDSGVSFTGAAGNFAITGDGTFVPFDEHTPMEGNTDTFFVRMDIDVGGLTQLFSRSGAPSSLPTTTATGSIGLSWPDFNADPDRFLMTINAELGGMVGPLMLNLTVDGLVIDTAKIRDHMFPIIGMNSIIGNAQGTIAGTSFNGVIIVGLIQFDENNNPLPSMVEVTADNADDIHDSVMYVGARAAVMLPSGWGVDLMFGFSELGFLQAYVRANVDIPLGPTGLVLTGFRGGITFNATALPEITDPADLRAPIFKAPAALTNEQWESSLRQLVINQKGGNGGLLFEADQTPGEDWAGLLDGEVDPGLYLPAGLRTEFLNAGVAITRSPNTGSIVALNPGTLWLLKDSGSEFLIEKDNLSGKFTVSRINFSIDGGFIDQLPAEGEQAALVSDISFADADGTHALTDVFLARRISLASGATVVATDDGWEISDPLADGGAITYTLKVRGDADTGTRVLTVEGGDVPMSEAGNPNARIRIDAGFSLSSAGGSTAWRLDADAIVVIGASVTDVQFVLLGSLSVGPAASPTLSIDAKVFMSLAHVNDATNPHVEIFMLTDFFSAPTNSAPGEMNPTPRRAFFSTYGIATLTLPSDANGHTLGIRLDGSPTQGLAVFDTGGLTQGALADQRFRLGGPSTPGGTDVGFVSLTFSNNRLEFAFDANLSMEGIIDAASVVHTSGVFVINFENVDLDGDGGGDVLLPINLYGAAKFSASSDLIMPLHSAGISGNLLATLKINTSGDTQTVMLGQSPNIETVTLKPYSLAIFAGATLTFSPPVVGGAVSTTIAGFFSLEVAPEGFSLLILGTAPIPLPVVGTLGSPLQGDILGAVFIRRHEDNTFDFGGRLEFAVTLDPSIRQFISFDLELRMYMNTSGEDVSISLPQDFMSRFAPTLSQTTLFNRLTFNPDTNTLEVIVPGGAPSLRFDPATYDTNNPGDQTDAPGPYICFIGVGDFTLGNEQDFGFALAMHGDARIKFGLNASTGDAEFMLGIHASTTLAPLGTLTASGEITIVAAADGGGVPTFDTWGSFQLAGNISVGQLSLFAAVSVDVNTSPDTQTVPHYYNPNTRTVIPADQTPISVDMPPGLRIFAGGSLNWGSTQIIAGEFTFAATSQGLSMTVLGVLNLQPIAGVSITGALDLYSSGDALGYLSINAAITLPGFTLTGNAFLKLNTLDTQQTLHLPYGPSGTTDVTIDANSFEVYIDGGLELFGGTLTLGGKFWLTDNPNQLAVRVEASIGLADFFSTGPLLSIGVVGGAVLYKNTGVLLVDVSVNDLHLGIQHLLSLDVTNTYFQLNTGNAALTSPVNHGPSSPLNTIAPGLQISGRLGLTVVGLELASVSTTIAYEPTAAYAAANGAWHIHASLNVNLFDIVTLNGTVDIYSRGAFYFSISGGVDFGNDWFGASFSAGMTFDFRAQNDGNGDVLDANDLNITGHFEGEAHAGIKVWGEFIGVSLGAGGRFNYNGSTHEMTVYVFADFGDLIGEVGGTFSLGTLDFQAPPPPPRLAGPGADEGWAAPVSGGVLYLNVGNLASYRNLSESETTEQYTVEAIGAGTNAGQKIRVSGFGLVQVYDNVTGIVGNFAGSNDYFFAGRDGARGLNGAVPLTVPVTVTGGDGNDTIIVRTAGTVNIQSNAGADYVEVTGAGGTVNGGDDDDTITWNAGAETAVTLDGGAGVNALQVVFTSGADRVLVDRPATGFLVKRLNASGAPFDTIASSNFMVLTLTGERGADEISLADLVGSGVRKVIVDLSQYDTGMTTSQTVNGVTTTRRVVGSDHDADLLSAAGTASGDAMNLATGADTLDLDGDGDTTEPMLAINVPNDSDSAVIRFKVFNSIRADGDAVTVHGAGGDDAIDASAVATDLAALTLAGDAGDDTITGSAFADTLDGGLGNDTLTGGLGVDTFADAGGHDTLVESRAADLRLTDDSFVVGVVTSASRQSFGDQYSSVSEFEDLNGIFEAARLTGGAQADLLAVGDVDGKVRINGVLTQVGQQFHGRIDLAGGLGGDAYIVTMFGNAGMLVNIADSGGPSDGVDSLRVYGSNLSGVGDTVLLRPNFVAAFPAVRGDGGYRTSDRVNYSTAIEGGLSINTLLGNDTVVTDDNTIAATINTGGGRDLIQIGQVFGSERTPPRVATGDEFGTSGIDLTPTGQTSQLVGYVSNGASSPLTVNAGDGNDTLVVFRNVADVQLNGEGGSDTFTVRSFALAGAPGGTAGVSGGAGADFIEYATNANVDINGGDGLDAVRVLGTQFGDTYVVTEDGVSGSGLMIHFTAVETLELHAGDGDDTVYVLATPANLRTTIFGGAGSDRFFVTGQAPGQADRPLVLGRVSGPILFEGGPGDPTIFGIPAPFMLPGETDMRLPPNAGSMSSSEAPDDRDTLDILDTDATADASGVHAAAVWPDGGDGLDVHTLSGLGMGGDLVQEGQVTPGGISYRRLEIVEAALGSGRESLQITSVAGACTTVFRGNGGDDRFTLTAPAAAGAILVVFGDTSASATHSGTPGNDLIDASASSLGATFYGGPGTDTILGSGGPDRIAGGSGADILGGGGGDDAIFGDSGFDFDRVAAITTIRTTGTPGMDDFTLVGADTINPGDGDDIVFGDHGLLTQAGGAPGVLDTGADWAAARTVNPSLGGDDAISARADANAAFGVPGAPALAGGNDLVFGGLGADTVTLGDGNDTVLGDHGRALFNAGAFTLIEATDPNAGGGDQINSGGGNDRVVGGTGSDTIDAGADNDTVFGDHGRFDFSLPANADFTAIFTGSADGGASDAVFAGSGDDIVLGQQSDDLLFGQEGQDDLIGGHNVADGADELDAAPGASDRIDGGAGDDVIAGDNAAIVRVAEGSTRFRSLIAGVIYLPDGTLQVNADAHPDPRGAITRLVTLLNHDASAPTGTFGDDLVAGGAGDDMIFGQLGNDTLRGDGLLSDPSGAGQPIASASPANDGDDYIEGNGGDDSIWGDLGRDDLVGGSSDLFGLASPGQRLDGADLIYGGAGDRTARNDPGETTAGGHALDSDFIAGDNADIFRLVDSAGTPLTFGYDNYSADPNLRLLPRGIVMLDYTPGVGGTGAPDEVRAEAGDDTVYGMTGNDTLYGDGQDDDLFGGVGDDWIYGGTGRDGIAGDDALLSTARNGVPEPLYGIDANAAETVTVPGVFSATIFSAGDVQKFARLLADTQGGADVVYGGLGDDFIHAGAGIDSVSGAEAMDAFYNIGADRPSLVYTPSLRRFTVFDPGTGLRKIDGFFLNFDAAQGATRIDDGRDQLFGDNGHDWLVGGTNQDRLFGGMGDDVLNADDNLETNAGRNFGADSGAFAEPDLAFGGGGLDRLIGNTTGDRLIDWVDQFNQYLTPFSGAFPTVVRNPTDALIGALLSLGRGSGADQLLTEPAGELGLVRPSDPEWTDQLARPITVNTTPTVLWLGDSPTDIGHQPKRRVVGVAGPVQNPGPAGFTDTIGG